MSTSGKPESPIVSPDPSSLTPTLDASAQLESIHDPVQQARNLRQILEDDKVRVGFLLGAGCPLGVYDERGLESLELIPAVKQLTNAVADGLKKADERSKASPPTTSFQKQWDTLVAECSGDEYPNPTVEDVLTELRALVHRRGKSPVLGWATEELLALDVEICRLILDKMRADLPSHRCSYHRFASWIAGMSRLFPVEIFTPNYDLLFEQAFERSRVAHFDGFVGSHEPFFDLASIEHDNLPPRWARIWKLHGSINWKKVEDKHGGRSLTRVVRVTGAADASEVMVYPSHLKYDQSRRMPYLAMLDRLRAFFRSDSGRGRVVGDRKAPDAPRLVICGYAFLDEHLNEVLLDGLRGNQNAHCFALMYSSLADHRSAVEYATGQRNLTVLARDGGVIGTREGLYRPGVSGITDQTPWLYEEDVPGADHGAPQKAIRSRLGDFHHLTLFLEHLYGQHGPGYATS